MANFRSYLHFLFLYPQITDPGLVNCHFAAKLNMSDDRFGEYRLIRFPVKISRASGSTYRSEKGVIRDFMAPDCLEGDTIQYPTDPHVSTVRTRYGTDITYHTTTGYKCFRLDENPTITINGKTIQPQVAWLQLKGGETTNGLGSMSTKAPNLVTFWSSGQKGCMEAVTGKFKLIWAYKDLLQYETGVLNEGPDFTLGARSGARQMAARLQPEFTLVLQDSEMTEQRLCLKGRLDLLTQYLSPMENNVWILEQSAEEFANQVEGDEIFRELRESIIAHSREGGNGWTTEPSVCRAAMPTLEENFDAVSDKSSGSGQLVGLIPVKTQFDSQSGDEATQEGLC